MRFLRMIWRLLVGVKDALVLIAMLLFFGLLYAALTASPNPQVAGSGALLIAPRGGIVEQPAEAQPIDFLSAGGAPLVGETRLRDILWALEKARGDGQVKAVVLDLDGFTGAGQAAVETIGEAMDAVRRAGKPVLAFATGYTDDRYQLAAHASELWLDPLGAVLIAGLGGSQLYYKGLLDRLGVTTHVYRVGTFKSAVEPYERSDQSPAARAANQALADALWSRWQEDVGRARPKARLAAYVAGLELGAPGAGSFAERAAAAGMVDRLGDRVAFGRRVSAIAGQARMPIAGDYRAIPLANYLAAHPRPSSGPEIGVLTVAGTIVDGEAGPGTAGAETVSRLLLKALAERRLRALVVRIDSPGGSVTGSDRIRSAILEARRQKLPVVVSMGSVAASGGYWIATAGQRILAEPATITGSIGVFGILPTFQGTLAKLGLGADGVGTTPLSGQPDLLRGTSPQVDRLLQGGVEQIYGRFVGLVATARHLTPARVDEIAQGRVWPGGIARQLGLIDRFGGLDDAIAEAARMARVDPATVRPWFIEREPGFGLKLLRDLVSEPGGGGGGGDAFALLGARQRATVAGALAEAQAIADGPSIQARCLDCGGMASAPARGGWLGVVARLF